MTNHSRSILSRASIAATIGAGALAIAAPAGAASLSGSTSVDAHLHATSRSLAKVMARPSGSAAGRLSNDANIDAGLAVTLSAKADTPNMQAKASKADLAIAKEETKVAAALTRLLGRVNDTRQTALAAALAAVEHDKSVTVGLLSKYASEAQSQVPSGDASGSAGEAQASATADAAAHLSVAAVHDLQGFGRVLRPSSAVTSARGQIAAAVANAVEAAQDEVGSVATIDNNLSETGRSDEATASSELAADVSKLEGEFDAWMAAGKQTATNDQTAAGKDAGYGSADVKSVIAAVSAYLRTVAQSDLAASQSGAKIAAAAVPDIVRSLTNGGRGGVSASGSASASGNGVSASGSGEGSVGAPAS